MTIHSASDLPTDIPGVWCRQSRLAGVVRFIVFTSVFATAPILGWRNGLPWVLWPGIVVAGVFLPLLLLDVAALFAATNWLLYLGPDGMWINLRSYRDKIAAENSVVRLEYAEISTAGRHTETYSTPSRRSGGSTIWTATFLEIRLTHKQTDELKTALNHLFSQPDAKHSSSHPPPVRSSYATLWLVSPSILRVAWSSGHGPLVKPSIARTLTQLDMHVRIATPTQRRRPNWRGLTADEVEQLARELIHVHGAYFEATALLSRAGGVTDGEAQSRARHIEAECL